MESAAHYHKRVTTRATTVSQIRVFGTRPVKGRYYYFGILESEWRGEEIRMEVDRWISAEDFSG